MEIAFVISTRGWGGVKTWTLDVAEGLAALGHGVRLFARPGPFAEAAAERGLACEAFRFGVDFSPLRVRDFLRRFRRLSINRVVCNVGKDLRTAGVAARLASIPVAHRVGLVGDLVDRPKIRLVHRFVRPRLLAPCEHIKRGLLQEMSFLAPEEIAVVHTGKRPCPDPPAAVHSPRRIVAASQLNPDKGHADLLRALADLAEEGVAFECEILGSGRDEGRLRALSLDLGLEARVRWAGFTGDVAGRLARADVFALPSYSEGLPNSLLEAMAQGVAPVARNVGGVAEAWPPGLGDFLVGPEPGHLELQAALELALTASDERLLAWKTAAWEHLRERFSLQASVRGLEAFLHSLGDAP